MTISFTVRKLARYLRAIHRPRKKPEKLTGENFTVNNLIELVEKWLEDSDSVSNEELMVNEQRAYNFYQAEFPQFNNISRLAICAGLSACTEAAGFQSKADLRKKYKVEIQNKKRVQHHVNNYRKLTS